MVNVQYSVYAVVCVGLFWAVKVHSDNLTSCVRGMSHQ